MFEASGPKYARDSCLCKETRLQQFITTESLILRRFPQGIPQIYRMGKGTVVSRALLLVGLFIGLGLPAFGQTNQIENPRIDIFGGYSHVGNYGIGMSGWIGTADWHLYHWLGVEGDVSGDYGTENLGAAATLLPNVPNSIGSRMHSFDFGPNGTYHPGSDKYDAFGHLLFGFSHTNVNAAGAGVGDTSFSWILGGGADYDLTRMFALRAQLDLLHTDFFNSGQNHGRIALGVVYRFGKTGGVGH